MRAPNINGSGTGKGLLVRAVCSIAFGRPPQAFTGGADRQELEKRLASALITAEPAVFLDNLNGIALQSDLLASALTETPALALRPLGRSELLRLDTSGFVTVTGNGLTLAEDLVRRFVTVELDATHEDPEFRSFAGDLLVDVRARRADLLGAALTIWRWGASEREAVDPWRPARRLSSLGGVGARPPPDARLRRPDRADWGKRRRPISDGRTRRKSSLRGSIDTVRSR